MLCITSPFQEMMYMLLALKLCPGGVQLPRLWKNRILMNLTLATNEKGSAYSVFVSGNDVYAGGFTIALPPTGGLVAKYWKNDVPVSLTDGTKSAEVRSIFVLGNDVYAAGREETAPGSSHYFMNLLAQWVSGNITRKSNS